MVGEPSLAATSRTSPSSQGYSDPGTSSYELKAIIDDFGDGEDDGPFSARTFGQVVSDEDIDEFDHEDARASLSGFEGRQGISGRPAHLAAPAIAAEFSHGRDRGAGDPWYSRLFQGWAMVFLAWAGVLLIRGLIPTFVATVERSQDSGLFGTIAAVVLLVSGAAGLFLLVDLGRYIAELRSGELGRPLPGIEPARSTLSRMSPRFWRQRLRAARSITS